MATADTRSGFRLPWSSDRSHDDAQAEAAIDAVDASASGASEPTEAAGGSEASSDDAQSPDTNVDARPDGVSTAQLVDSIEPPAVTPEEHQAMVETVTASAAAAVPITRKPSKLLADLATAMRATAETAREQALAQVEADVRQVVEAIRNRATEAAAELRQRSDEDIAGIRDWSKAEIARIREETERRISGRKSTLDDELVGHAAAVNHRIEDVQRAVTEYEAEMAEFFERLLGEDDAARLATMAETMPEPPALEPFTDLDTLEVLAVTPEVVAPEPEAVAEPEPEAVAEPESGAAPEPEGVVAVEPGTETEAAAEAETVSAEDAGIEATEEPGPWSVDPSDSWGAGKPDPWGAGDVSWGGAPEPATPSPTAIPGWMAELPDGTAAIDASGGPVDREAVMAALEAAAEAIVASEAVGQTAGSDSMGSEADWQFGAEAAAALAARMDAAGFSGGSPSADIATGDASVADEAAPDDDATTDDTATTQLMVTGLVSVASIASFKRHLSRMAGVRGVAVSSGPDGEFVFNVSHQPDLSFSDTIPTMPGFAARVTGKADGIVNVTARDPETEG